MERGETKNSNSPMWRCITKTGERVNIFQHSDPAKNTARLFANAGYMPEMSAMALRDVITWQQHPIGVVMHTDGQWWNITAVEERPQDVQPDPQFKPNLDWYKQRARFYAQTLINDPHTIFFDTETSGTGPEAEIISIAVLDHDGHTIKRTMVKPCDMAAVEATTFVHQLTPADLQNAPSWPEVWEIITRQMARAMWCAYNVEFDAQMIEQNCARHGCKPLMHFGLHDAMKLYSYWAGLWEASAQKWKWIKLAEAVEAAGIEVGNAHDALADTKMMYSLVQRMAE